MPREPPSPSCTSRFVTSADQLGFSPPPIGLRLKLVRSSVAWSLYLQPLEPAPVGQLVDWLEAWTPLRIEFGSRRILRADFDPLPEAWRSRYASIDLDMARLMPDGSAQALVKGPRAAIAAFSRVIALPAVPVEVRRVGDSPSDERLLTKAQDEALRVAVAAGYYKIPRPLNLHDLAARLGISSASLSERLRRAEGRVIARYVNEGGKTPWDEMTLYDPYPEAAVPARDGPQKETR